MKYEKDDVIDVINDIYYDVQKMKKNNHTRKECMEKVNSFKPFKEWLEDQNIMDPPAFNRAVGIDSTFKDFILKCQDGRKWLDYLSARSCEE